MTEDSMGEQTSKWCALVVPCYDEEHRLQTGLFSEFLSRNLRVRFLFVNDGSHDQTLALLDRLRAEYPTHVSVLDLQINVGKAEAVRRGMLAVIKEGRSEYTGFWDADLATPLSAIPEMLERLIEHPRLEMIFGSRVRLLGRSIQRNPTRHYLGRVFATVVSLTMQLPIYDTQCGAKLFRITPTLLTILDSPFQSRWIFDVEIIARFIHFHRGDRRHVYDAIYENPLHSWVDVAGSKIRPLDFVKAFFELIQLRTRYLR